jgi:hypothetical protein
MSRPVAPETVTWVVPLEFASMSHAAAAVVWLSTPPVASVAAIQRPSAVRTRWPTA